MTGFEFVLRESVKMNFETASELLKDALRGRENAPTDDDSRDLTVERLKRDVQMFLEDSLKDNDDK